MPYRRWLVLAYPTLIGYQNHKVCAELRKRKRNKLLKSLILSLPPQNDIPIWALPLEGCEILPITAQVCTEHKKLVRHGLRVRARTASFSGSQECGNEDSIMIDYSQCDYTL